MKRNEIEVEGNNVVGRIASRTQERDLLFFSGNGERTGMEVISYTNGLDWIARESVFQKDLESVW
jgi:hypothetical protein